MSQPNSSAEPWPIDAAPEKWVSALFEKMGRMWGNRFLDQWRDLDIAGVRAEWGKGLRKLSNAELKAGVDALLTLKFPPSLPEFYGLCKQMRLHEIPKHEALTDQTRANPEVVEANLKRMREILAPFSAPKEETAEWAFKLLMRAESASGKALPHETIRCASDAISSNAGRKVVENCRDPELRENYASIREAVLNGYRNANKPAWETK